MCLNPIKIRTADGGRKYVPCGHCLQCLKSYQDSWIARLNEESKLWPKLPSGEIPIVFFTLDYRPESVPCTYLCCTSVGNFNTDSLPSTPYRVHKFWTDTTHESKLHWLSRRKSMLTSYWQLQQYYAQDLNPFSSASIKCPSEFSVEFKTFKNSTLEHPFCLVEPKVNLQPYQTITDAFEFHSVKKSDVQSWLKRGRRRFERFSLCIVDGRNSRQISSVGGRVLPSSCLTKTIKYFITSEYGPKTHRPHYHGCMFGITLSEFKEYFAKDWTDNFGTVNCSELRQSGGALSYIAKYCAKGHYEHPYCCKDFFYKDSEYHSRHYELSITDFGIDLPLVAPTFHLISKGLGISYCFNLELLSYLSVNLEPYLTTSGNLRYFAFDDSSCLPSKPLDSIIYRNCFGLPCSTTISIEECDNGLVIKKYLDKAKKYLLGVSTISVDDIVDYSRENLLFNLKYTRTYVKSSRSDYAKTNEWFSSSTQAQVCTTSIPIPRYFKKALFTPLVSCLVASASDRFIVDRCLSESRIIQSNRPQDEVLSLLQQARDFEALRKSYCEEKLRRSSSSFISQSKF